MKNSPEKNVRWDGPTIRDYRREKLREQPARAAGEAVLVRLATRLYLLRTSLNMTQEELANRSGLDQASISDVENGDANPTIRTLGRLASGLGVDAAALLTCSELGVKWGMNLRLNEGVRWEGRATGHPGVQVRPARKTEVGGAREAMKWVVMESHERAAETVVEVSPRQMTGVG